MMCRAVSSSDITSSSDQAAEDGRAIQNCNQCYSKKVKCDRKQPSCSGCVHLGLSCQYEQKSRFQKICEPCRAAKKKCSKELSGCSRCNKNGITCTYPSQSSGYRKNKRRLVQNDIAATVQTSYDTKRLRSINSPGDIKSEEGTVIPSTLEQLQEGPNPVMAPAVESFFYNLGVAIRTSVLQDSAVHFQSASSNQSILNSNCLSPQSPTTEEILTSLLAQQQLGSPVHFQSVLGNQSIMNPSSKSLTAEEILTSFLAQQQLERNLLQESSTSAPVATHHISQNPGVFTPQNLSLEEKILSALPVHQQLRYFLGGDWSSH